MNKQRYIIASIAVAIFAFLYEWGVHGVLLEETYNKTADLWRTKEEMQQFFPWCLSILAAFSLLVTYIYTRNYEGKGVGEGARFGLLLGALLGIFQFGAYTYLPISIELAATWFVVFLFEGVGIGIVLGLTYKQ